MSTASLGAGLGDATASTGDVPDTLLTDLDELGLNGSQARVLLALLQLGTASSSEIARVAQIPRTAVYPVLQDLDAKRLVGRVGGETPAVWSSPGRDEVLDRLAATQEERIRLQQARLARVRAMVEALVPAASPTSQPFVHFLPGPAHARAAYEQLMSTARSELLVFTRPPYTAPPGPVNPGLLAMLGRGIRARVVFQAAEAAGGPAERQLELATYRQAGVESRMVNRVPVKMVIADRRLVLVAIPDVSLPDTAFPTSILVDNEGYAAAHVAVFEMYWATALRSDGLRDEHQ